MITYCSRFIPNFATITDSLRHLLLKDSDGVRTEIYQKFFQRLKELLLSSETLAYYVLNSYTEIVTDALAFGAGIAQPQHNLMTHCDLLAMLAVL